MDDLELHQQQVGGGQRGVVDVEAVVEVEPVAHRELAEEDVDVGRAVRRPPDLAAAALERVELALRQQAGGAERVLDLAPRALRRGDVEVLDRAAQRWRRVGRAQGDADPAERAQRQPPAASRSRSMSRIRAAGSRGASPRRHATAAPIRRGSGGGAQPLP